MVNWRVAGNLFTVLLLMLVIIGLGAIYYFGSSPLQLAARWFGSVPPAATQPRAVPGKTAIRPEVNPVLKITLPSVSVFAPLASPSSSPTSDSGLSSCRQQMQLCQLGGLSERQLKLCLEELPCAGTIL